MNLNRTRFVRLLKTVVLVVVVVIVLAYAISRSLPYAEGLSIDIYEPIDGTTIASTTVSIVGRALRVSSLTLNGSPISIDESGNFKEKRILFPGTNILTLEGQDQFGRAEKTKITLFRPR